MEKKSLGKPRLYYIINLVLGALTGAFLLVIYLMSAMFIPSQGFRVPLIDDNASKVISTAFFILLLLINIVCICLYDNKMRNESKIFRKIIKLVLISLCIYIGSTLVSLILCLTIYYYSYGNKIQTDGINAYQSSSDKIVSPNESQIGFQSNVITDFSHCQREYGSFTAKTYPIQTYFTKNVGSLSDSNNLFSVQKQLGIKSAIPLDSLQSDSFTKIIVDEQGNYIIVGKMSEAGCFNNTMNDCPVILKLDPNFNIIGYNLLDIYTDSEIGARSCTFNGVIQDENNNYVTVGYYFDGLNSKSVIVKFDSELNILTASVTDPSVFFSDIIAGSNGLYYAVGNAQNTNNSMLVKYGIIVKYNSSLQFENIYTCPNHSFSSATVSNNDIVVVGYVYKDSKTDSNSITQGYIDKLDSQLNEIQSLTYSDYPKDKNFLGWAFANILEDEDGSLTVNAYYQVPCSNTNRPNPNSNMQIPVIFKISNDLDIIAEKTFDDNVADNKVIDENSAIYTGTYFNDIVKTQTGYICVGVTDLQNSIFMNNVDKNYTGIIVNLDNELNYLGCANFGNSLSGSFSSVAIDHNGDIITVGTVGSNELTDDKDYVVKIFSIVDFGYKN